MSDIALTLLDRLRQNGVDDDDARRIAQSLDQSVENVLREAIAHADRHRAETAEHRKKIRAYHRIIVVAGVVGIGGIIGGFGGLTAIIVKLYFGA